jgi:hypothetical protein
MATASATTAAPASTIRSVSGTPATPLTARPAASAVIKATAVLPIFCMPR